MTDAPGLDNDLRALGAAIAAASEQYLETVRKVASGDAPDSAIPLLLLAASDLSAAGARLGAIVDVVPAERFEPDDGPEVDMEPLRVSLANVLEGIDENHEGGGPLVSPAVSTQSINTHR